LAGFTHNEACELEPPAQRFADASIVVDDEDFRCLVSDREPPRKALMVAAWLTFAPTSFRPASQSACSIPRHRILGCQG
jgi:hypothetical protein